MLIKLVSDRGMNYTAETGEAAFYGPKIDFVVRDCIGREWQLGTVQLDYNLPGAVRSRIHRQRQHLASSGHDSSRTLRVDGTFHGHPDRALRGRISSLAVPEQARVMPVSEKFSDYGKKIEAELKAQGFRVHGDYRPEKIGYKIREAQLEKIPYMLVVGDKEQTAGTVAVRDRVDGDLGTLTVAELVQRLTNEIAAKSIRQVSTATVSLSDTGAKFED